MSPVVRAFVLILVIGMSITCGTVIEGLFPLPILGNVTYQIQRDGTSTIFGNRTLFARSYVLSLKVHEGGPVDLLLSDLAGRYQLYVPSIQTYVKYGVLPFRGLYRLVIFNRSNSTTLVRISLSQYGLDQQQMLLGELLFTVGFAFLLLHILHEWPKQKPSIEEVAEESTPIPPTR